MKICAGLVSRQVVVFSLVLRIAQAEYNNILSIVYFPIANFVARRKSISVCAGADATLLSYVNILSNQKLFKNH